MNDSVSIFKGFVSILAIPFTIFISLISPQKPQIYPGSMENYSSTPQEISTPVKNNSTSPMSGLEMTETGYQTTDKQVSITPPPMVQTTTVNSNPKIDCVGPDEKHFQATQKECDDFNSAWNNQKRQPPVPNPAPTINSVNYNNIVGYEPTFEGQTIDKNGRTYQSYKNSSGKLEWRLRNYAPTVNFTTITCQLSYGTYQLTQAQCDSYKQQDTYTTTNTQNSHNTSPSVDTNIQQQLEQEYQKYLQEQQNNLCQQIVKEWESFKSNWYSTKYNTYSSSGTAIADLNNYKSSYDNNLRSKGCSNNLSLY